MFLQGDSNREGSIDACLYVRLSFSFCRERELVIVEWKGVGERGDGFLL